MKQYVILCLLLLVVVGGCRRESGTTPKEIAFDLGNGVKLEMVLIPAGEFMMGSNDGSENEKPVHKVHITRPFYLGRYEVTQEQWQAVMRTNPSRFGNLRNSRNPVENVNWYECQQLVLWLNRTVRDGDGEFRLPTEAQWEYACRAGSTGRWSFGDDESKLGDYAWYADNCLRTTQPVGEKPPNAWGLYDMHGNVNEWCQDWYDAAYYAKSPTKDPLGPSGGSGRVVRCGGWRSDARYCRSADRSCGVEPEVRGGALGVRVCRVLAK